MPIRNYKPTTPGRRGSSVAFLAGELYAPDGTVVTTATATARIIRVRRD